MGNYAEIIISNDDQPFILSCRADPEFEAKLIDSIPAEQIREYENYRIGFKTWGINRDRLIEVTELVRKHFGYYSIYRSAPQPVNPNATKDQMNLFIM